MYSICLPWAIFPLTNPNFWTLNCLSFDLRFGFLLIAPDYSLFPLLYPLIVPLISSNFPFFLITPLLSSDLTVGIFRSLLWLPIWYLLIAPSIFPDCSLVPSNFPFCIFWLPLWYLLIPSSVSSDYPFCIFWLSLCIFWSSLLYLLITPLLSSYFQCWYLQTFCLVVIEIVDHLLEEGLIRIRHSTKNRQHNGQKGKQFLLHVICEPGHKPALQRTDILKKYN
jgi:hypothetical protein